VLRVFEIFCAAFRKSRWKSTYNRFFSYSFSHNTLVRYFIVNSPDVLSVVRPSVRLIDIYTNTSCTVLFTYTHNICYVGAPRITYGIWVGTIIYIYIYIHFNTETIFLTLLVNRIHNCTYNYILSLRVI